MPEGDTVWRAARRLDAALSGQVLQASDFRVPRLATVDLSGAAVTTTLSRGKHLLTRIDGEQEWTLHTHLKMEGRWDLHRPGERWRGPHHEVRVVLTVPTRVAVGRVLGVVDLVPRSEEAALTAHLGPDLLGPDWDESEAVRRLSSEPDRPLAQALLDQRNLAGIGNVFAAELCFTSGVPPHGPVSAVPDLTRLVRRAHQMLELNKDRTTRSTTGDLRPGSTTWVYGRRGRPCRRCGTTVRRAELGEPGRERPAYWCPTCQPG